MGRGIVNGLTSMGQAADNAATSWKHVLNPAYTAAQKSLAAARAQQSSGTMGAIGDPRRQDMTAGAPGVTPQAVSDAIAKAMQTLASTPQTIRVPSLPAPKEIRTLPQLTPAINAPSGGGGNNSGNPFAAAGMQQIGTAPSGAALWSNGNGQVFSGNAPSNLFGGMGFGGFAQCFGVFAGRANLGRLGNDRKAPFIIPQGFPQSPQARAHTARALGGNV